ncbi:MAG: tetratricopeptide repeat protein [Spirochaetota bacterium]
MTLPRVLGLASVALIALAACSNVDDYYIANSDDPEVRELYELIAVEDDPQVRAVAIERLSGHLLIDAGYEPLIAYLTSFVEHNPNDEYGGLYLSVVAQSYLESDAPAVARYYYERVVTGYPDVRIDSISLRKAALEHLVRLSPDAEDRVTWYRMLIDEYGEEVDRGLLYYRLAENLERLGEWDAVYEAYRNVLRYPDLNVPGRPNAYRLVEDRVEFYDSEKNWTLETVEDLRRTITGALINKDTRTLRRYQAGVNFFTRSWEQDFDDPNTTPLWDIGEILRLTRRGLSIERELDVDADGDEAYLWTYGWGGLRIRTWYLYFRKVHFPPDPEIHGTWEWAGVFLGERL